MMFGRKSISQAADHLIALLGAETVDIEVVQRAAEDLIKQAKRAGDPERNEVVRRFAPLIAEIRIGRAAMLALASGALVEEGASFEPMAEPTLARFAEAVHDSIPFIEACAALAHENAVGSGGAEVPQHAHAHDDDKDEAAGPDAESAIARFGEQVAERMPDAAQAFSALQMLTTAALAVLQRSKPRRRRIKEHAPLVADIQRFEQLGFELPCFREMLALLDDEEVIVLHPQLGRGYVIRIAGIGDNFQLHTLLADVLIGSADDGWLPGERPSREVAALAKDAPITDPDKLPTAHGAFNLWNWTGLRSDGTLPNPQTEGQGTGSEHWIWNEGMPADIVPFVGKRIILIGPAPYPRGWNAGRFFPAMTGELDVLRTMSADEARDWLARIAAAPKPRLSDRHITAGDINTVDTGDIPF